MTATAVIQAKRGIGDVMWHLPFIRAIATISPGGKVAFLAPPSSLARELLAAEPCVAETIYFEHSGSELRRAVNLMRLANLLRRNHFRTVWILDRTNRPAVAAWLAGVPERIGLGLGLQSWFITNSGIDRVHFHDKPIGWLTALMQAMHVPLPTTEPRLHVALGLRQSVGAKFEGLGRPWIVLGLGGSHPEKEWPEQSWREFLAGLCEQTKGTVFLIGGPENRDRALRLIASTAGAPMIDASGLKIGEVAALLQHADLFVGPDSGPMNIAVSVGTDAFALFGATFVLTYSKHIHPIVPDGGPAPNGMQRILPAQVLDRIKPRLARSS